MFLNYINLLIDCLLFICSNRKLAEHQLNRSSSRSHVIYTIYITRTTIPSPPSSIPEVIESKIQLVDLAGSEKTSKTKSEDSSVLKQAKYINKSLSYLEQVVLALLEENRVHIPYRQCKLTHILKDCFGGNTSTHLIACLWLDENHNSESISTLRFASRMRAVKNAPIIVTSSSSLATDNRLIGQLKRQIQSLKSELISRDAISGVARANLNSEERNHAVDKGLSFA